ncbi:MAG: hypothetical protein ABIQ70_06255 [Dokdonella sp.]
MERNIDYAIEAIGEPYFRTERFVQAIEVRRPLSDVVSILGNPKSSRKLQNGAIVLTWVYGESEMGETYRCEKLADVDYRTWFTTMEISFGNDGVTSCKAKIDTFITKVAVRYEGRGDPIDSKDLTCDALARRK